MIKHTKIGATIGPASQDIATIQAMVAAGMNFARLNFSHGTYDEHAALIATIRNAERLTGEPLAILQDLQGPKMRLGALPKDGVAIVGGQKVIFNTAFTEYSPELNELPLTYPHLDDFLKKDERILIDDGHMEVKITKIDGSKIEAQVIEGGTAFSHKGLNFPDSTLLTIPALSQKDQEDVKFGVQMGVDIISLSFVKRAQDILDLRALIKHYEEEFGIQPEQPIRLVGKIERFEAVDNLEEILEVADAIMVARGDLGLEMPSAQLPLTQKKIIAAANKKGKPVIVATQMLDSMQHSRRPTRAEVSDVANAVIDHADALLLTNETAMGEYPALTVKTMQDIIVTTEQSAYDDTALPEGHKEGASVQVAITEVSRLLAEEVKAKIILAASFTGETGKLISQVRPRLPILVATLTDRVRRQLNISWGVKPFVLPECHSSEELVESSIAYLKKEKMVEPGDMIIIVGGESVGQAGNINSIGVREVR